MSELSVSDKNELLFSRGINFNKLPCWQRRGIGIYWEDFEKPGINKKTGQAVTTRRRRLAVDLELPLKDAYDRFLSGIIEQSQQTVRR